MQQTLFKQAATPSDLPRKFKRAVSFVEKIIQSGSTVILAYSSGKDSTMTLVVFLHALMNVLSQNTQKHYILTSDTGIESPLINKQIDNHFLMLQNYINEYSLPIELVRVMPSLNVRFQVATLGRGKLPTFVNSNTRDCAYSWKVQPIQRFYSKFDDKDNIVTLTGKRQDESDVRLFKMKQMGETATSIVVNKDGYKTATPIADFSLQDVWEGLLGANSNGPYASYAPDFDDVFTLYEQAGGEGCVISIGETQSKACGSRFGCMVCGLAGESDTSMTNLLNQPQFQYLDGVNKFREYLLATRQDWSKRELINRKITSDGWVKLQPNNYSYTFRRALLGMMLSLDAEERDRAEQVEHDIIDGKLDDNSDNWDMASPQFRFIDEQTIVAIDFMWSIQNEGYHALSAIELYHRVHTFGQRYEIPELDISPNTPLPEPRWYQLDRSQIANGILDGLRDPFDEALRRSQGLPLSHEFKDGDHTDYSVFAEISEQFAVDPIQAEYIVNEFYPNNYIDIHTHSCADGATMYVQKGVVTFSKGKINQYHRILKRNQLWERLQAALNIADLEGYLSDNSISHEDYLALQGKQGTTKQFVMF